MARARGSTFPDVDMPPAHRLAFRAKARFADFEKRSWNVGKIRENMRGEEKKREARKWQEKGGWE